MRNKLKPFLAAFLLVGALFLSTAIGAGYPIKERFTSLIGGYIVRTLPTTATTDSHREAMMTGDQRLMVTPLNTSKNWIVYHNPAAGSVATISKAAEAGQVHVVRGWTASLIGGTSAPTATYTACVVRDGATGAGTIKAGANLGVAATAGYAGTPWTANNVYFTATSGTAVTIEFGAASGANTIQSVSMWGETIPYVAD